MNKMTKGAVITGLGVALLLGGSGTLAVWNADQSTNAGVIASGELDVAAGQGVWTDAKTGDPVVIKDYRAVPGDSLKYTQPLTVTLEGDNVSAVLSIKGAPGAAKDTDIFDEGDIIFSQPELINEEGENVLDGTALESELLDKTETLTASTIITFREGAEGSMNAAFNLDEVKYHLEQQVPGANAAEQE